MSVITSHDVTRSDDVSIVSSERNVPVTSNDDIVWSRNALVLEILSSDVNVDTLSGRSRAGWFDEDDTDESAAYSRVICSAIKNTNNKANLIYVLIINIYLGLTGMCLCAYYFH